MASPWLDAALFAGVNFTQQFPKGYVSLRGLAMRFLSLSVCCLLLAVCAFAQSDRGTITGTVSDPAGAVVANAPIQAKNLGTGVEYASATSTTGNYTLLQLPPG